MFTSRTKPAVTAVAALAVAASLLSAGAASAKGNSAGEHTQRAKTACTVTSAQRAATLDQIKALKAQLEGHKLTHVEKDAVHKAIAELVSAARDAKMPPGVRDAKRAELRDLVAKLKAATSPAERDAIRAEARAIVLELQDARLTGAERAEIAKKAKELVRALKAKPSGAERDAIRTQVKTLTASLSCKVTG